MCHVSLSGSIMVVGGWDNRSTVKATEALSLQTMTFAVGPTMLTTHQNIAVFALLQDFSSCCALVVGGYYNSCLSTTEVLTASG